MQEFQALVEMAPWTMIAMLCNLLLLTLMIKKFLFKPVQAILAQREQEITKTYDEATQAKTSAEEMRAEYEQRLAAAKEEATDIVKTATARAQARSEELLGAARTEAAAAKVKADAEIEAQRKKAAGALKNDIAGIALEIAGKVVEKEIDPTAHKSLIDAFIDNVGDAS